MNQCNLQIADTFDLIGTQKLYDIPKCWKYLLQQGKLIYGNDFILNKQHKAILLQLLAYAIDDAKTMAKHQLDPRKGILLMGETNSGKTAMMRLIKSFFPRKKQYNIKTCRLLSHEFSHKGFEATTAVFAPHAKPLVLDNLGKEDIAKHYGYACDVAYTVVEHFYEQRHDLSYPMLHITTTLSPSELEKKYGIGFRKMLTELFNIIVCES